MLSHHITRELEIGIPSSNRRVPLNFCCSIGKGFIFSLCTRSSHCLLLFTTPGNKIVAQKDTETSSRPLIITTSNLICISEGLKRIKLRMVQLQNKVNSLLNITQEVFDKLPMDVSRAMHILGEFVNYEGNVTTSE